MLNFFKRKGGKADSPETPEPNRKIPKDETRSSVDPRPPRNTNDVTNETRKDVVNLLLPDINYNQKSGVGAIFKMMAGKRRKTKKNARTESCRISPPKETNTSLQRSKSDLEARCKQDARDAETPTGALAKNTQDTPQAADNPADFVKALVLQKYTKTPEQKPQHVSRVYVSNELALDDKRHAEALLREIAKSIDCTIDKINAEKEQMGNNDSKTDKRFEPVYETIEERPPDPIDTFKNDLRGELEKLLQNEIKEKEDLETESLAFPKKSNLKPPKPDADGCSDDGSDCGKKKVTFQKHIVFDDGEQQTDEEVDSSFDSLSSEEGEYVDNIPDNDELLGGVVVSRNEENKTVINVNEDTEPVTIKVECVDEVNKISSDNSDSGFLEFGDRNGSGDDLISIKEDSEESETETEVESGSDESVEIEEIEEIEEEEEDISITEADVVEPSDPKHFDNKKTLVSQESKFQSQVAALTELADSRCGEAESTRAQIVAYRKEIEDKDQEIERLKLELAAAYKESELIRQRSRALEEELAAARGCSADLASQLQKRNDEALRQLRSELEDALMRRAELESKVLVLERDRDRLEHEKQIQEQKAEEALTAAEANTAKWRAAHESARSQAAARAELMLADCEWKMRELEKRAREAEKQRKELTQTVEQLKAAPPPNPSHIAELQQLRGLATEQQRSVQSLTLQLQRVETREEALKLEVHRLKELLEREMNIRKDNDERHLQTIERLEQQHSKTIEALKTEHANATATTRANLERAHAERTRAALAQLRAEAERDAKNADRKLREVTTRFENLKEVLASKEAQFEKAIGEAHSKADWDIMQLRHLLDKSDITYATNIEQMQERFEKEKESLIEEWSDKLRVTEEEAASAAAEAKKLLETTRMKLVAEKNEQLHKLKEKHKSEMDDQWEQFMTDKENCLSRMKLECRQEGEEDRVQREKELLEEIAELKALVQSKSVDFDNLAVKAASCGRTLAVTEQELKEALAREKELREKRAEDATKLRQAERANKDQIEHLTRKCACLRKLFDDMRARLSTREHNAEQEMKAKEKEIHQLRAEVARLTKLLVQQDTSKLGKRTSADGCETLTQSNESTPSESDGNTPRRKGGSGALKIPEFYRKRPTLPDLAPLPPEARRVATDFQNGRRRANSVDLPPVQVPGRIKQLLDLQEKNIKNE